MVWWTAKERDMNKDRPKTSRCKKPGLKELMALQGRRREECDLLLKLMKERLPLPRALLAGMSSHWGVGAGRLDSEK